jgi:citrate/tricarballylate utilization protein
MPIADLFEEARRQLNICNACRYCEGYCAVFPALERRNLLDGNDLTQLANLCHDCRACFDACMYAPPHEFGVNPPAVLAAVRRTSYDHYVPRWPFPARLGGLTGATLVTVLVCAAIVAVVALVEGAGALVHSGVGAASPYEVVSYPVLLALVLAPCAWSVTVTARAAARYWRDVGGPLRDLADPAALWRALRYAVELRYLRGGGEECHYPTSTPTAARRRLHAVTFYGFLACSASTASAAFMQDILGSPPPYPYLSVPVALGLGGGIALVVGCTGLMVLKARSEAAPADREMVARDFGFLVALNALSITGLLTLLTRTLPVFEVVFLAHLAAVIVGFAIFPYTKFMHFVYRFLAIVQDNQERATEPAGVA